MRAGRLRHRVRFEEKGTVTQNALGEEEFAWEQLFVAWGSVEPIRGREYRAPDSEQAQVDTVIRMRYHPGVKPTIRAVWLDGDGVDHTYDVITVKRVYERNREMEVMCRENVPV